MAERINGILIHPTAQLVIAALDFAAIWWLYTH